MESKPINTTNLHYTQYLLNKHNLKDYEYEVFDKTTFDSEYLEYYNYIPKNKSHILVKSDDNMYQLYKVNDVGVILSSVNYELIEEFQIKKSDIEKLQEKYNQRYLIKLLETDNIEIIKNFVDSGFIKNINFIEEVSGETPLTVSATNGIKNIRLLVEDYHADINMCNSSGESPITVAAKHVNYTSYKYLLEQNDIDLNVITKKGNTLLHHVVHDIEFLMCLLEKNNSHINTQNEYGETPLHCATHKECVQLLLTQKNIDPTIVDKWGNNFLHRQLHNRHITDTDLYRSNIVDVNSQNNNGHTLLHLAIMYGIKYIAVALLGRDDIDINISNNKNMTPMMLYGASKFKDSTVYKLLLKRLNNNNKN